MVTEIIFLALTEADVRIRISSRIIRIRIDDPGIRTIIRITGRQQPLFLSTVFSSPRLRFVAETEADVRRRTSSRIIRNRMDDPGMRSMIRKTGRQQPPPPI